MKHIKCLSLFIIASTILLFTSLPVVAQLVHFSEAEQKSIARIESYFNELTTLKAKFTQIGANGEQAFGTMYMKRPGKLRFVYDPPTPITIIADGTWLIQYDRELEEASRTFLSDTPIHLLVREKVQFSGDVIIQQFEDQAGVLRISLTQAPAHEGIITFVFNKDPLMLKQWVITDPNGEITTIVLNQQQPGIPLEESLFNFISPEWERQKNR